MPYHLATSPTDLTYPAPRRLFEPAAARRESENPLLHHAPAAPTPPAMPADKTWKVMQIGDFAFRGDGVPRGTATHPPQATAGLADRISAALSRAAAEAHVSGTDIVVCAGGLWDDEVFSSKECHAIARALRAFAPIPLALAPGTSDPWHRAHPLASDVDGLEHVILPAGCGRIAPAGVFAGAILTIRGVAVDPLVLPPLADASAMNRPSAPTWVIEVDSRPAPRGAGLSTGSATPDRAPFVFSAIPGFNRAATTPAFAATRWTLGSSPLACHDGEFALEAARVVRLAVTGTDLGDVSGHDGLLRLLTDRWRMAGGDSGAVLTIVPTGPIPLESWLRLHRATLANPAVSWAGVVLDTTAAHPTAGAGGGPVDSLFVAALLAGAADIGELRAVTGTGLMALADGGESGGMDVFDVD